MCVCVCNVCNVCDERRERERETWMCLHFSVFIYLHIQDSVNLNTLANVATDMKALENLSNKVCYAM